MDEKQITLSQIELFSNNQSFLAIGERVGGRAGRAN